MGIGRAVWGVGRGVKLAKLSTGGWSGAAPAQAGQYTTIGQGAKAGLKEAGAITKKDPFGVWSMGYGGIGKSHKLSGKTKHSVGQFGNIRGQTNVGKLRKGKRDAYESAVFGDPGRGWFPGPQLALPGSKAAKSLTKVTQDKRNMIYQHPLRKGKKGVRKRRTTMKDVTFGENVSDGNRRAFSNMFTP